MQENVKAAWRKRLYASASAVALGCLLPISGNAGPIDVVSAKPIDPALANMPRISAPSRWSTYKAEPKLVSLAVPVPAMAPAPLMQQKQTVQEAAVQAVVNTIPKRRMSALDVAWTSQSPKPSISSLPPVHAAFKQQPRLDQSVPAIVQAAAPKTIPLRVTPVAAAATVMPQVQPIQKTATATLAKKEQSPLDVLAALERKEPVAQEKPVQTAVAEPVAVIAAAKKDIPVTPPIKLTDATAPVKNTVVAADTSQDLWKEFDGAQTDVATAAPPHLAKVEPTPEKNVAAVTPLPAQPIIKASLTEAAQTIQQTKIIFTHSSPIAITSAGSPLAQGLWQDFDTKNQPEIAAADSKQFEPTNFEPSTLEPAAGGEPLSLMPPSVPKDEPAAKQDLPGTKLLPPVAETKAMTAEEIIAAEADAAPVPAPGKKGKVPAAAKATLSAESMAVLDSLPPEVRTGGAPKKNVTLERSNKTGSGEDAVKKHEAYGMKISVKRPKVDVFRMLESAYNSLIAGDQQYAITLYKEVLDEEPDNTLALFGLATTYHRAGQTTLARPLYGKLLEIDPHNVEGLNNFLVLLADESPDAALEELEKLRQSHPSFSPVLAQMALIHERRGEYDLAVQKLGQAYNISPENLKYQYNMAIVLDKMKDWPEASKWYQRLLTASERGEKIPGNPQEIQQRLTFIRSNTSTVN